MRKSGRTADPSEQPQRPWLRRPAGASYKSAGAKPASSAPTPVSRVQDTDPKPSPAKRQDETLRRFVEPYQYDDAQREAIDAALVANGLGDGTARAIFIGAIAYDLAVLQSKAATPTPLPRQDVTAEPRMKQADFRPGASQQEAIPAAGEESASPVDPALAALAEAARAFAACLLALRDEQRSGLGAALRAADRFDRVHDSTYWDAVRTEAERIAGAAEDLACGQRDELATSAKADQRVRSADNGTPNAVRTDVASGETTCAARSRSRSPDPVAINFVRRAADVYEQCFDEPPSAMVAEPFARVLTAVGKTTGVAVPTQARVLKSALLGRVPDRPE